MPTWKELIEKLNNVRYTLHTPKDLSDEVANTTECAKYSNQQVSKLTGIYPYGDAWTRGRNCVNILSGYDGLVKPNSYAEDVAKKYVYDAADQFKKLYRKDKPEVQDGDVVGLYFRNSPNWEKAFKEGYGGEAQTHTGHIVIEDGVPYVVHNVHTNVIKNKLEDLLGSNKNYGVVSLKRVKK